MAPGDHLLLATAQEQPDEQGCSQAQPEEAVAHVGHHQGQAGQPLGDGIDQKDGIPVAEPCPQQPVMQMTAVRVEGGAT